MAVVGITHFFSPRSSALVGLYLAATMLFDVVEARSYLASGKDTVPAFASIFIAPLKLCLLVLEETSKVPELTDNSSLQSFENGAGNGFWTRRLFLWLNKTLFIGFRKLISTDDLDELSKKYSSAQLHDKFKSVWVTSEYIRLPSGLCYVH
jgi:hypothetical protein